MPNVKKLRVNSPFYDMDRGSLILDNERETCHARRGSGCEAFDITILPEAIMYRTISQNAVLAAMVGAIMVFSACSGGDDAATTDTGMAAGDTGAAMMGDTGIVMPGPSASGLSDANIFYILDRANILDSAAGAIASTKGTNSEIRGFGKMMTRDHHGLREQGQLLAKRLNITPAAPPNDTSEAKMSRAMSTMNSAAKGRDFDKAYIGYQVTDHVNLLATATQAMAAAQNPELKNMIQKATPVVQAHLDSAQAIQRRMM